MLNHPFLSKQRAAVPSFLLKAAIIVCGVAPLLMVLRSESPASVIGIATCVVASLLAFLGFSTSPSCPGRASESKLWIVFMLAAFAAGCAGLVLQNELSVANIAWLGLLPLLVFVHGNLSASSHTLKSIIVPFMFGSIFMFVSSALGKPILGAFPAVIGMLFIAVICATLDIEEDIIVNHADSAELEVEHEYRRRLAITAVIFFLFGTVSLWPWLGQIYSQTYFWILLFGVLLPLAFFWGRIRQPKIEGAQVALIRFNRIAPILGLIYVVALVVA